MRQVYSEVQAYQTKDGSEIRELLHPAVHGNQAQSLAEASLPPGTKTLLHRHLLTEEIYHITAGAGCMTLGEAQFAVAVGDTICILPGTPHCIEALGDVPLKLLCCCSPAYRHEDTELIAAPSPPEGRIIPGGRRRSRYCRKRMRFGDKPPVGLPTREQSGVRRPSR